MKDQQKLAAKCRVQDIPFFTLCGNDELTLDTLKYYYEKAKLLKCNPEFLADLKLLIEEFHVFKISEPEKMKLPD